MVDCFDRIAVQMTEIALEPVRMLQHRPMLSAVSLRTPSGGKRYEITIAKRFPDGPAARPVYVWSVAEINLEGSATPDGQAHASAPGATFRDPEAAYWDAVSGLCASSASGTTPR